MNRRIIYTKFRLERAISEKLASLLIEVYFQLLRGKSIGSIDVRGWELLFKSYYFVNLIEKEKNDIFSAGRCALCTPL